MLLCLQNDGGHDGEAGDNNDNSGFNAASILRPSGPLLLSISIRGNIVFNNLGSEDDGDIRDQNLKHIPNFGNDEGEDFKSF